MEFWENIKEDLKQLWPNKWEEILNFYQDNHNASMVIDKLPENFWKNKLISTIEQKKQIKNFEQHVLNTIIPKNLLKHGVTYLPMNDTQFICRHVSEARWDEEKQVFWYTRFKFGQTFEDTMEHFCDTINSNLAGFTPIKEK